MHLLTENNEKIFIIRGFHPDGKGANFGYPAWKRDAALAIGRTIPVFHLFHIVDQELDRAKFVFRGLKRPLLEGAAKDGDKRKLVYCWVPISDFDYDYGKRFEANGVIQRPPPPGRTYMVIVTPNNNKKEYPSIDYWLERWTWVQADPDTPDAPIDFRTRYDSQLKP